MGLHETGEGDILPLPLPLTLPLNPTQALALTPQAKATSSRAASSVRTSRSITVPTCTYASEGPCHSKTPRWLEPDILGHPLSRQMQTAGAANWQRRSHVLRHSNATCRGLLLHASQLVVFCSLVRWYV